MVVKRCPHRRRATFVMRLEVSTPNKMNRIVYRPWSERVLKRSMVLYKGNRMPVLDLELSAACNLGACVYCDSEVGQPSANELNLAEVGEIVRQAVDTGVEWVYICGLGEPMDDCKFMPIMELFASNSLHVSMFTNALGLTKSSIKLLRELEVCMVVKLDTFDCRLFDKILGRNGSAEAIYHNIDVLIEQGYSNTNTPNETDLAFSIVPTQWTLAGIPDVVRFCADNNIFPCIGELEYCGRAKDVYAELALDCNELLYLKEIVDELLGYSYHRPVCPALITGLHITSDGECVVHDDTGLCCHWFFLRDAKMLHLGSVREDSLNELCERVRRYRCSCANKIVGNGSSAIANVFGGCGGQVHEVVHYYMDLHSSTGAEMIPDDCSNSAEVPS